HENCSDRRRIACDNCCRLCSLRLLLIPISRGKQRARLRGRAFFAFRFNYGLISMAIEIVLDSAPIVQYSLKYGKDRCRRGACRARPGSSSRRIPAAGGGWAGGSARRRDRQRSQTRAEYPHLSL